ncbi:FFLEELY motif protein [Halomonadaceae bacterium KBTZ08]
MYRYKLTQTQTRTPNARRLQELMLSYHDFRQKRVGHPLEPSIEALGCWQAQRLRETHRDLYESPRYHEALDFLLEDLYAPQDFSRRDDDFDRIFPYLIRLSPDSALFTLSQLVELNLISQRLDLAMAEWLTHEQGLDPIGIETLSDATYAEAYRACGQVDERQRQIELMDNVGRDLERYVDSRSLRMGLKMMHQPARMAGLGDLYQFITEGVHAFRAMGDVSELLETIRKRETRIMKHILAGGALPRHGAPQN